MQLQHRRRRGPTIRLLLERESSTPLLSIVLPGWPTLVVMTTRRVIVMMVMVRGDHSRNYHN